jgi:flagellar biogenesis protein FliO
VIASTVSIAVSTSSSDSSNSSGGGCVYNPNAPTRFDMGFILLMVLSAYYLIRRKRRFVQSKQRKKPRKNGAFFLNKSYLIYALPLFTRRSIGIVNTTATATFLVFTSISIATVASTIKHLTCLPYYLIRRKRRFV